MNDSRLVIFLIEQIECVLVFSRFVNAHVNNLMTENILVWFTWKGLFASNLFRSLSLSHNPWTCQHWSMVIHELLHVLTYLPSCVNLNDLFKWSFHERFHLMIGFQSILLTQSLMGFGLVRSSSIFFLFFNLFFFILFRFWLFKKVIFEVFDIDFVFILSFVLRFEFRGDVFVGDFLRIFGWGMSTLNLLFAYNFVHFSLLIMFGLVRLTILISLGCNFLGVALQLLFSVSDLIGLCMLSFTSCWHVVFGFGLFIWLV